MLLVLLVVIIGICILLPVLVSGRQHARDTICLSNLRQLDSSMQMYVSDYDNHYPSTVAATFTGNQAQSTETWRDAILPYVQSHAFLSCPLVRLPENSFGSRRAIDYTGYAYNQRLSQKIRLESSESYIGKNDVLLNYPVQTVTLFDARAGILALREPDMAHSLNELHGIWRTEDLANILKQDAGALRHHGGANYSFADGHVKWLIPTQVRTEKRSDGVHPGFGL
jgi:prepilin-type processing-associated H-X9-DG protein